MTNESLNNFALLVVDIQNDFCHDDGVFAKLGLDVKPAQEVTPKIKEFIKRLRKYKIPIIYSKQIESDEVTPNNLKRQFENGKLKAVCAPKSWGSDFYQLKPIKGEYIIEKYTYDVFSNPEISEVLKKYEIKTLILVGVNTDVCVDTTVRSAFTKGYQIIVLKDLVATMNKSGEKYYLDIFDRFFGDVMISEEIIKRLK